MSSFINPLGGTELMYNELMKRLPNEYKEKFSIFNYISDGDFSKPTIFWNQLSYDQKAIEWLKESTNIDKINQFVFVSHWQSEYFRKIYNISGYKTTVIQNACIGVEHRVFGKREKIKICYTSTPFRGLEVLLKAWEKINHKDCELHIFSSCEIYGKNFFDSEDYKYQELYDFCKNTDGIVYRGSIPNNELREELPSFDILAYPCTFEETSCIAVIEALSAGLSVITNNLGALPETTEGCATIYPFLMNKEIHATFFSNILEKEIEKIRNGKNIEHLTKPYAERWNWDNRIKQWINFLDTLSQRPY